MPPRVALLFILLFVTAGLWYLRKDSTVGRANSILWLPVVWIFFAASKFPSQWLATFELGGGGGAVLEDGSPLDALFFLVLILVGIAVLIRRRVRLPDVVGSNVWLAIFFTYCFLSIAWSDFPFVAFKRWVKVIGHPVMALVILTDPHPLSAVRTVFARAAVVMMPLSILFIKYYPELGRYFDPWTGEAGNGGIHHNKNELGYTCMVFGIFFIWNAVAARRIVEQSVRRREWLFSLAIICMVWWLLSSADSATSLVCTFLGGVTVLLVGSRLVSRRFLGVQIAVLVTVAVALEMTFGIYAQVVELLGRNPDLTDRTEVWADLFAIDINPLLGAGFESFWLGWRLDALWGKWWWKPTQAHNGYIETYVNLGWLGVFLLSGVIFSTFRKGRAALIRDVDEGRLRLAFLVAILAYNYTEAAFKGVHLVWTVFHLIAMDYPRPHTVTVAESQAESGEKAPRRLSIGRTVGTLRPVPSRRTASLKPASSRLARTRDARTRNRA